MNYNPQTAGVSELLVGFDAREYRSADESLWPIQRREQYLYRLDVKKVLSVDVLVWPTIFAAIGIPIPPHQTAMQDLWNDRGTLRKAISQISNDSPLPAFRTVAITLVADGAEGFHPTLGQAAQLMRPQEETARWQFVGFDVADSWMLSALSNCGFLPGYDDVSSMRRDWTPHLNEFHLFVELGTASAFRRMSDRRLAGDHAPTFVYAIYILSGD
jgi:hypothetical protein